MTSDTDVDPAQVMVVINLAALHFEFQDHSIYTCPALADGFKPSYKHYPARYAGIYINKGAPYVAEVEAVVRLVTEAEGKVLWKFTDRDHAELVDDAKA